MPRYNPTVIEPKWQQYWEEHQTFAAPRLPGAKKMYVLDMFPYPSGNGLHVGHPEGYTATDIVARFNRMNGVSVMHPMGWDAFGLPAEQYAKKTGIHPRLTTEKNINTFRRQLKMLGFSYDWNRELATTDVEYFRWTQFIFLVLYDTWYDAEMKKGRPISELPIPEDVQSEGPDAVEHYINDHRLAYQLKAPVNWCPQLGTVLANEEIIDGKSERGGYPVLRVPMRQWMLRITAYADRLEEDLKELDWSEGIKLLQRNWIGRSTGGELDFFVGLTQNPDGKPSKAEYQAWRAQRAGQKLPRKQQPDALRVYTTRPDTLFGATYMVISPEHPMVERLTTPENREKVEAYRQAAAAKSELDRTDLAKEKTGVFSGSYAFNPVNDTLIPIWIADYVLANYGTGAIMAVPAHDTRDFDFAKQFGLPIIPVVDPIVGENGVDEESRRKLLAAEEAFTVDGVAVNSGRFNGMKTAQVKQEILKFLAEGGFGRTAVNYKLRDWLFSRQHIWGEPFPILHELDENGNFTGRMEALSPEELPLNLPQMEQFDFPPLKNPEPPLEHAPDEWLYVERNGKRYKRETNSMPQWAGSCWYYLRYLDPRNHERFVDPEIEKAWMPVDLYVGGAEHAVLHLLYARFWHKVLYDRGYVTTKEPFHKLVNQGMILGEMEYIASKFNGEWISLDAIKSLTPQEQETVERVKLSAADVEKKGDAFVLRENNAIKIDARSFKMSKSRGNVINPDDVVRDYGADSLRLYEMFMGPLESVKPWSVEGVTGVRNFLDRVWRLIVDDKADDLVLASAVQDVPCNEEQARVLHKTIKAVTNDLRTMQFNTGIARMMEFTNYFAKQTTRPKEAMSTLVLLLSPYAPHIAEELWSILGHTNTLAYEPWPTFSEEAIAESHVVVPVQVNGKIRSKLTLPADADAAATEAAALSDERVKPWLEGKTLVKKIVVPGKMVNLVVK